MISLTGVAKSVQQLLRVMDVRLRDVAKLAGVSVGTASQALNNKPRVSPSTRERVLLAVNKLNYRPHAIAKQLALGRTDSLTCFVIPSVKTRWIHPSSWVFYYPIIGGILDTVMAHRYRVLLEIHTIEDIRSSELLLNLARGRSVAGACFVLQVKDDYNHILTLKSMGFPLVTINANISERISSIGVENTKAVQKSLKYLLSLGHRKIAFISGPMNHFNSLERLQGYQEVLYESGLKVKKQWIVEGNWTIESGYQCAGRIIESGIPTAMFCSNDYMAIGAMRRIKEGGLSIPDDVSVMGYDDSDVAKVTVPPLSSVRQPLHKVGELAAGELVRLVEGEQTDARKILLEAEIVKRQSCAVIR